MESRKTICVFGVLSLFTIYCTYVRSFLKWSFDGIPLGWDTAAHMAKALKIAKYGLSELISEDFINSLYHLCMSPLALWNIKALYIYEVVTPLLLTGALLYVITLCPAVRSDVGKVISILTFSCWPIIYRLLADLHPSLLSLTLTFLALNSFLRTEFVMPNAKSRLKMGFILTLAMLAHFETTSFYLINLIAGYVVFKKRSAVKIVLRNFDILFPALMMAILYVVHLMKLFSYSLSGSVVKDSLTILFGMIFTIISITVLIGLAFKNNLKLRLEHYFLISMALSICLLFLLSFIFVRAYPYYERAIMIFPYPVVSGAVFEHLLFRMSKNKVEKRLVTMVTGLLILISIFVSHCSEMHLRTWISQQDYQALISSQSFCKGSETICIFVFNDVDEYSGGLATLYDSWTTLLCGEHFSYLGTINNLLDAEKTRFKNVFSKEISNKFFRNLKDSGVLEKTRSCNDNVRIIIIKGFYRGDIPPFFKETFKNLYVANLSQICKLRWKEFP